MNRGGGRDYMYGGDQGRGRGGHGRGGGRGRGGRGRGRGRGGGGRGRGGRNQHHRGGGGRHYQNQQGGGNYVHNIGTTGSPSATSFTVAVQGCSHGELDSIYDALEGYRAQKLAPSNSNVDDDGAPNTTSPAKNIDVLLCCGDVQTLRNTGDFHSLNVPPKYKAMGDFHAYYSGQKVAPILTIMIGGNHESSNYLQELHYGGWVAPNIYYMGAAGVVNVCKRTTNEEGITNVSTLRIAGASGIYNSRHYTVGRFEMPPYDRGELRSVYHTREVDVKRLQALAMTSSISSSNNQQQPQGIDIMISHDWPRGIAYHGNIPQLVQRKPFFKQEIEDNELGSPANEALLHTLKPKFWFAAHLHVKFEALVRHGNVDAEREASNEARADSESKPVSDSKPASLLEEGKVPSDTATTQFHGMETYDGICPDTGSSNMETLTEQMTRFLSLDKCLPKRRHIQITHLEPSSSRSVDEKELALQGGGESNNNAWLEYDANWLAVVRRTHGWTQRTRHVVNAEDVNPTTNEEIDDINMRFEKAHSNDGSKSNTLAVPQNFVMTVPPHDPSNSHQSYGPPQGSPMIGNPQTDHLLQILGLDHRITVPFAGVPAAPPTGSLLNRRPPLLLPQPLIPSAVIRGRPNNNMPNVSPNDENEIDLDEDQDETESSSNNLPSHRIDDGNEIDLDDDSGEIEQLEDITGKEKEHTNNQDSAEIVLDDAEDDAGEDSVCLAPPGNVAKKPRTEN